jgi:hypothetical protein
MKHLAIILFFILSGHTISAQDSVLLDLRTKNAIHQAIWSPNLKGVIFTESHLNESKIDTIGAISTGPYGWLQCVGNDSCISYFRDGGKVSCIRFEYVSDHWQMYFLTLPPVFPLVGAIFPGKKYENYRYTFLDNGQVEALKRIFITTIGALPDKPSEQYKVLFEFDKAKKQFVKTSEELIRE